MIDAPATKQDIDDIIDVIKDLTHMISRRFEDVDVRMDAHDASFDRLGSILRPTIDHVDDHKVRIKKLEQRPA